MVAEVEIEREGRESYLRTSLSGRSEVGGTVLRGAVLIALSGLASRLLGLLRDRLFAHQFGAGEILDAYFAAYRIPDILYNLLVIGALSAAFLPVVSRTLSARGEGRDEAFRMTSVLLTVTVVLLACIAVVLWVLAPVLVPLLVPGFSVERQLLTVRFTRIMLLQPMLLGASSILGSLLLAFRRFTAYAVAPVVYNVGIIAGVLLFVPVLGPAGLAWGVVLGALLHLALQLLAAHRLGFLPKPTWRWNHRGLRQIARLFGPRVVSLIAGQASDVVVTVFGSRLLAGAIAAYLLAGNLQFVPIGLVGIPLAVAAFPFLAAAAAQRSADEFRSTLVRTLRLTLFYTLPAAVFLLLLRAQVVRVVLGTGAFDWEDTVTTLTILGILALAIVSESAIPLLARAFFSLHDTVTPMIVSLLAILVNVVGALLLAPIQGIAGVAWAFTASSLLHFVLLVALLHRRLEGLEDSLLLGSVSRAAGATVVAGLVIQGPGLILARVGVGVDGLSVAMQVLLSGTKGIVASFVNMQTFFGVATQLSVSALVGAAVYALVAWGIGASELRQLPLLWRRWLPASTPERGGGR